MATVPPPLLASQEELLLITTVAGAQEWAGLADATWRAFDANLGTVPQLRIFASLPLLTLQAAMAAVRVPLGADPAAGGRELTAVEVTQVGFMWRVARQKFGMADIDPLLPAAAPAAPPAAAASTLAIAPAGGGGPGGVRRIKLSHVLDQTNDGEIPALTQGEIDAFYLALNDVKGGPPLVEADPTPDQISALRARIIELNDTPWADFALFTPFNSRFLKMLKFKSFIMQSDGSFKSVEVPGPASFEVWQSSWKVFANVLLGLTTESGGLVRHIVTPASLEEYFETFRELRAALPEAWRLCVVADDRCRAEHFSRARRLRTAAHKDGLAPTFNPLAPWGDAFRQAARDKADWDRQVRGPAIAFLARRSGQGVRLSFGDEEAPTSTKVGKRAKRTANLRSKLAKLQEEVRPPRDRREPFAQLEFGGTGGSPGGGTPKGGGKGGKGGDHPRKDRQGRFITTREGKAICFAFGVGKCGTTCERSMAHVCQWCLGQHRMKDCPKPGKPSL